MDWDVVDDPQLGPLVEQDADHDNYAKDDISTVHGFASVLLQFGQSGSVWLPLRSAYNSRNAYAMYIVQTSGRC